MYGVGGESELCFEQPVSKLMIDNACLNNFKIQLGITRKTYCYEVLRVKFTLDSIISFED